MLFREFSQTNKNTVKQNKTVSTTATFLLRLSRVHLDPFGPKNVMLSKEDLRRFVKLIDLFRFTLHFRDAHHFREIFACNIASINRQPFCLGLGFARAISGHFLGSKFGDLSIFFLVFNKAWNTFLCKTDLYYLEEQSKKLIIDMNYKFNKKLLESL